MIEAIGLVKEVIKDGGSFDLKGDAIKIPDFKTPTGYIEGVMKDGIQVQGKQLNAIDSANIPDFKILKGVDLLQEELVAQNSCILPRNRGEWEGESGGSIWRPDPDVIPMSSNPEGKTWGEILKKYGITGIPFKDGYPDFSEISEETVEIDDFSDNRNDNFNQADKKTADQWNEEGKDGRTDWKGSEVKQYRQDNKLTWHECEDTKTLQLVPAEIHNNVPHTGGISVMKQKG